MKDWTEFNAMKDAGWKTKTLQEYNEWKQNVKEWYTNQELTDWDKEQIKKQLEKINESKQAYFNKPQFKGQPKKTYLLQDDLAAALTKYVRLKTMDLYLEMEAKYGSLESLKSISDEKKFM